MHNKEEINQRVSSIPDKSHKLSISRMKRESTVVLSNQTDQQSKTEIVLQTDLSVERPQNENKLTEKNMRSENNLQPLGLNGEENPKISKVFSDKIHEFGTLMGKIGGVENEENRGAKLLDKKSESMSQRKMNLSHLQAQLTIQEFNMARNKSPFHRGKVDKSTTNKTDEKKLPISPIKIEQVLIPKQIGKFSVPKSDLHRVKRITDEEKDKDEAISFRLPPVQTKKEDNTTPTKPIATIPNKPIEELRTKISNTHLKRLSFDPPKKRSDIAPILPSTGITPYYNIAGMSVSNHGKNSINNGVENYKYEKIIGQGGYAVVRLAAEKTTNEKVAIKTYEKYKLFDNDRKRAVKREIAILSNVNHPNIIKLYKTIDNLTQIHLIIEYCGLNSLQTYLKTKDLKRLDEIEAKKIFKQIVNGIAFLHSQNILHRDIKAENLMITEDGVIKIIDFGFSVSCPKDRKLTIFCGTPSYMAPEIASKQEYYGHSADIWALGILLHLILTGSFPFKGKDEKELFKAVYSGKFDLPDHLSRDAQNLVQKILKINPHERLSAEQILQEKWLNEENDSVPNFKQYLNSKIEHYKHLSQIIEAT